MAQPAVKPDNVDDTNLKRLAGTPAVSVAATKRPAEVTKALLDVSRAELEYDAAQTAENRMRQQMHAQERVLPEVPTLGLSEQKSCVNR